MNVRQKQKDSPDRTRTAKCEVYLDADALVRLINIDFGNGRGGGRGLPNLGKNAQEDDVYKLLVYDGPGQSVISPLMRVQDLRKQGITLHLRLEAERQNISDVPAVYLVSPSEKSITKIIQDLNQGLYDSFYLNFTSSLSRPLLERLAEGIAKSNKADRVCKVYDQYINFTALEKSLFTLNMPDCYTILNDTASSDELLEATVNEIVDGLFSVLVTLGIVPVIRAQPGGPAEMIARNLDMRIRDNLKGKYSLFSELSGLRPMLCLIDRTFDLAIPVMHSWIYKPLVHDILGIQLNKVTLEESAPSDDSATKPKGKPYELEDSDDFWMANGKATFPKVGEEVEVALNQYKKDIEEVNRKAAAEEGNEFGDSAKNIMSAVSSLPELTERKKKIDKHTNIATSLLEQIKKRSLDAFVSLEEDIMTTPSAGSKGVDMGSVLSLITDEEKGSPIDKLRLALVYVLTATNAPSKEMNNLVASLKGMSADVTALEYIRKLKSKNTVSHQPIMASPSQTNLQDGGKSAAGSVASASSSTANLLDWADKIYGQGLNVVTAGVKSLLGSGKQLAITRLVEALMEGRGSKSIPEIEKFVYLDPKSSKSGSASAQSNFREAIVFVVGGGSYLEQLSLLELGTASQANSTNTKNIIYGSTTMVRPEEFIDVLSELGRRSQ